MSRGSPGTRRHKRPRAEHPVAGDIQIARRLLLNPITLFITIVLAALGAGLWQLGIPVVGALFGVAAVIVAASLKMANAWQKFVILRAGKLNAVRGPGLFFIIPILDSVTAVIDERIQTTAFTAEQA